MRVTAACLRIEQSLHLLSLKPELLDRMRANPIAVPAYEAESVSARELLYSRERLGRQLLDRVVGELLL